MNLLIADDVGLGKTIEAGLIVRELLLRRRVDFIVVAAPPSMTLQWQDELEAKFGLSFQIIDRDRLAEMRRMRGFGVNPWATGPRFIISHRLLTEETYVAGLRDLLGNFRSRTLLILDEAHHAAPASGTRYAVASQFTKAIEDIAKRFEHRLFLSATPHNGHSNSFSTLLEILDPQRFTRGVEVRPTDLEPVMVRRLKADLRRIGKSFPERIVKPITLSGLPEDAPELRLARMLSDYGELREKRLKRLPPSEAASARMIFVGLQQRLLSSVAAFAKTLKVHHKTLQNLIEREAVMKPAAAAAKTFTDVPDAPELFEDANEEDTLATIDSDDVAATEAASQLGAASSSSGELKAELEFVEEMLRVANSAAWESDARIRWLVDWMRANMLPGGAWNDRRLILFTEYEDTRRWLERQLKSAFSDTDRIDERIGIFTGATGAPRREELKLAFNADPASEPIRVLICTDAAREGINLQTRCYDLIHVDLPWNPSRLEQRNGRIDRKLQPAPEVFCRYFRYHNGKRTSSSTPSCAKPRSSEHNSGQRGRSSRSVSPAVFRRRALGAAKPGLWPKNWRRQTILSVLDVPGPRWMMKKPRGTTGFCANSTILRKALERARERVGVAADDLRQVVEAALSRSNFRLGDAKGEAVGEIQTFQFDPKHEAFSKDSSWADIFDDLRQRKRKRGERLSEWRSRAPIRAIAFQPPVLADGRDAPGVVQMHLEHRLVRRLLSRFISQGFQSGLNRACVIEGPGAQPRVILLGRLALYGPKAARLHEEIIAVTAIWPEADRGAKPLRVLGEAGEATTLAQLEEALKNAKRTRESAKARVLCSCLRRHPGDAAGTRAARQPRSVNGPFEQLRELGEAEAQSLAKLLESQRLRIRKAVDKFDPNQLELPGMPMPSASKWRRTGAIGQAAWPVLRSSCERSRNASGSPTRFAPIALNRSVFFTSGRRRGERNGRAGFLRSRPRMAGPCASGWAGHRPQPH